MPSFKFYYCETCLALGRVEVVSTDAIITQTIDWIHVEEDGGEVTYLDNVTIHERNEPRYQCYYCGVKIPVEDDDELVEWMREHGVSTV